MIHQLIVTVDSTDKGEVRKVSVNKYGKDFGRTVTKDEIEKDMAVLAEGLVSLMHYGHQLKIKDSAEAYREILEQLESGFLTPKADVEKPTDHLKPLDISILKNKENTKNEEWVVTINDHISTEDIKKLQVWCIDHDGDYIVLDVTVINNQKFSVANPEQRLKKVVAGITG